jgi:hypothetical protein
MKKEFFQALLAMANKLYSLRGVRNSADWMTAGCFYFEGRLYSFLIEGDKGTFRCMQGADYPNEWFGVTTNHNKGRREFTSAIFIGERYFHQPTLF